VILVTSGAVVDPAKLAAWLRPVGRLLPVRHAIKAVLRVLQGDPLPVGLLVIPMLIGLGWGLAGYLMLRYALARARRKGLLDPAMTRVTNQFGQC
jgi:hypothetical protein